MSNNEVIQARRELKDAIEEMNRSFKYGSIEELLDVANALVHASDKFRFTVEELAEEIGVK
jgi:hypothetical protein